MLLAGAGLVTAGCAAPSTTQPATEAEVTSTTPTPTATQTPTSRWRAGKIAPAALLAAYANDSVQSGQPLQLHVSAAAPWKASIYRIGFFGGKGGTKVAETRGDKRLFTGKQVDPTTRAVSAGWPVVTEVDTTGWTSGLYTVVVRTSDGGTNIPFVVRPASAEGKVAILAASMTWQAYNIWGGASLYKNSAGDFGGRSYAVSYDRPYDHALWGAPIAMGFDIPVARFADEVGIDHVWFSNADIARDPGLLKGAVGVVSTGHDEYWPQSYRQGLLDARDSGSDLAFLGANAGYWRVGLKGDEVYCAKDAAVQPKNIRVARPRQTRVSGGGCAVRRVPGGGSDGGAAAGLRPVRRDPHESGGRISRPGRHRVRPVLPGPSDPVGYRGADAVADHLPRKGDVVDDELLLRGFRRQRLRDRHDELDTIAERAQREEGDHRSIRGFQPRSHRQSAGRHGRRFAAGCLPRCAQTA